ncbi:MAG: hypothetical protein ACRDTR_13235 [Rubrobacter sp.]
MVDSPIRRKSTPGSPGGGTRGAEAGAEAGAPPLPPGYALDASDPDLLLVLREDGTVAAAFSARGATAEGILEAAEQDTRRAKRLADRVDRDTSSARNGLRP